MKIFFLFVFSLVFLSPFTVFADEAEEEIEDPLVVKIMDGHKFKVPEDMPIERKDGIVAPMSLDKYVAIKFSKIEKRLGEAEDSIKNMENAIQNIEERLSLINEELSRKPDDKGL